MDGPRKQDGWIPTFLRKKWGSNWWRSCDLYRTTGGWGWSCGGGDTPYGRVERCAGSGDYDKLTFEQAKNAVDKHVEEVHGGWS